MRGQSVGERGKSDRGGGGRLEGRKRETEKSVVGETGQAPVRGWQRLEDPSSTGLQHCLPLLPGGLGAAVPGPVLS